MFVNYHEQPNQSPEPMRGIAVSPLSRLDVFWSRMAQLRMLGIQFARLVESAFSARAWDVGFVVDWFVEQFFFIRQPFD